MTSLMLEDSIFQRGRQSVLVFPCKESRSAKSLTSATSQHQEDNKLVY